MDKGEWIRRGEKGVEMAKVCQIEDGIDYELMDEEKRKRREWIISE